MSDSTTSRAEREGEPRAAEARAPAGEGGFDAALRSLASLDSQATQTFQGAVNLNDLLRLATGHCRKLVDCEVARIWLMRRNGRRLAAVKKRRP